ncbi:hypothetical protein ACPUVO_02055 [Pseudocolwellia sp. HL-MZ19]|uniref:hypothetical protein n=1 Tax=unclassified Pseudocolwellia TaxID=2848178 RepID=UPI003CECB21C
MKLSRVGWNNVIIFSVMAFILLINVTHNKIFSDNETISGTEQATLFSAHETILTLTFSHHVAIERIGKNWRATPAVLNEQGLDQMMRSWKNSEGEVVKSPPVLDEKMALVVNVELADQVEPYVLNLFATDTELLIFNRTTQVWKSFPLAIFSQLVPNEIFSA